MERAFVYAPLMACISDRMRLRYTSLIGRVIIYTHLIVLSKTIIFYLACVRLT